ncbi:class I SAM-dependent methyltransferase [Daejeonella oryzae]|uniref:class I SAM-dependent methyltransferase n=1 Tax=Daejeonella oryzae TaxID=1122943 RepID=UPI00041FB20D|nr:class I SAM-dependent methyltransferase [Daejeonella oryzae]
MINVSINPLLKDHPTVLIKKYSTQKIITNYKKTFDIDVKRFFEKLPTIELRECISTGYKFYYPFGLAGDGKFYSSLQKWDWYYMPWKWEHQKAFEMIEPHMKVLEIGCAEGSFLKKLIEKLNVNAIGLEFNEDVVEQAKLNGLPVYNESLEDFAVRQEGNFDAVCSFQVLEHIANVKSFLENNIKCLKKGGKLIIGVPNNKSFLRLDEWTLLNMPPHHMGLWTEKSLKNLENHFPIKLKAITFEPPQDYHSNFFASTINQYINKQYVRPYGLVGKFANKFFKKAILMYLNIKYPSLKNVTILAEFVRL